VVTEIRRLGLHRLGALETPRALVRYERERQVSRTLGISQRFTQSCRPQTNGKAERFIRTLLTEWTDATVNGRSARRTATLPRS